MPQDANFVPDSLSLYQANQEQLAITALCDWIADYLAARFDVTRAQIEATETFQTLGLNSLAALEMLGELGSKLHRPLAPTLVWEFPTPIALARYLASDATSKDSVVAATPKSLEPAPLGPASLGPANFEPIAIVGMSCRFPQANTLDEFWNLLRSGVDAITEVPKDRWNIDFAADSKSGLSHKLGARWGGFLSDVQTFDPAFFGISPREAVQIDPQQRLALELAWEALEDAGIPATSLAGTRCGVYVGVIWHDYADLLLQANAPVALHTGTGQSLSIVANRISYTLGLQGPSIAMDTACSSSLVAIHLACKSLRDGESSLAVVGGVNLMLSAHTTDVLSQFGGLSARGQCRAFDADADGFVRGEGGGFVVLKPLSKALADADSIYCVIRGSAINNDGASNGLTAPNPAAQRAVLAQACQAAALAPKEVDYVEAHGTGTKLGDPLEAAALSAVLCSGRAAEQPLRLGSVKTNIGHQEGAAGIAGLIKTALAIAHRQIPPSLHFATANPLIPFSQLNLKVVTELETWPTLGPAIAGVSSFGWGGTNCHVLLSGLDAAPSELLLVGADDEDSLAKAAAAAVKSVRQSLTPPSHRFITCHNGGTYRLSVLWRTADELFEKTQRWLNTEESDGCRSFIAPASTKPKRTVFVFSPQGGQWRGMATNLVRTSPVFRQMLAACDAAIAQHGHFSILQELHTQGPLSASPAIIQPCIFAVQVALTAELQSYGIHPDVVVGHSLGEITAAYVAGALSLQDAAQAIVHYSQLQATTMGDGGMALLQLPFGEVSALLEPFGDAVCIAGHNGPRTTVLSGRKAALDAIVIQLAGRGIFATRIDVSVAAHGPQMDSILSKLCAALSNLQPRACRIPMWSTSQNGMVNGHSLDGNFFAQNLRRPVHFAEAIRELAASEVDFFVEVNAHPILLPAIQQGMKAAGQNGYACGTLIRGENEQQALLDTIAQLWIRGASIDLPSQNLDGPSQKDLASQTIQLIPLSARSEAALAAQAARLRAHLQCHPEQTLADVAYSLFRTRSALEHRLALVASSREALLVALDDAAKGHIPNGAARGNVISAPGKLAFLFTGQGAQTAKMGHGLYQAFPAFQMAFDRAMHLFERELQCPLREVMWASPESPMSARLDETRYTQPSLFVLEYALYALWQSWGLTPDWLVGHSIGELVAACVAGVFTLEDAVRLCAARGRLMQALPAGGAMASIATDVAMVAAAIASYADQVSIAAVNAPLQVVISGEQAQLSAVVAEFAARGVRTKLLNVSHAFHSALLEPMLAEFRQVAEAIQYRAPSIPLISNVTGQICTDAICTADYWVRQARQTVRFADGIQTLGHSGVRVFVELGPKPTLLGMVSECLPDIDLTLVPSLRPEPNEQAASSEKETALQALGTVFAQGRSVNPSSIFPSAGRRVKLPTYAFQRQRYWLEMRRPRVDPLADWLYTLQWTEQPQHSALPAATHAQNWLIFGDATSLSATLAKALSARGCQVTVVDSSEDKIALAAYFARPKKWDGVVYLAGVGGLDAQTAEPDSSAEVAALVHRSLAPMLTLWQELTAANHAARLWIVTRGACAVHKNEKSACWQAGLWGLGRVAALESPAHWGGLVDLDPNGSLHEVDDLVHSLLAPDAEDQIAFRQKQRYAARLNAARWPASSNSLPISAKGFYLVTGGLGSIGLCLAKWLVARGARHLLLIGRNGLPPRSDWTQQHPQAVHEKISAIEELEAQGAQVRTAAVDVGDFEQMRTLLASLDLPLCGVLHAAGVVSDGLLTHQNEQQLATVLRPKVEGTWVLHTLTLTQPLDFFVLFSSLAATVGLLGNGTYVAANAFLDSFASFRRAQGLPACSIAWGMWDLGMATASRQSLFAEWGVQLMPTALALSALDRLLSYALPHCLVMDIDWRKFASMLPPSLRHGQLIQNLVREVADATPENVAIPAENSAPQTLAELTDLVRSSVAQVLELTSAKSIHPQRRFAEMGMDSLLAVQLRNRLQRELKVSLSSTLAFDYPTIERLVTHLNKEVLQKSLLLHAAPETISLAPSPLVNEPIAIVGTAFRFPGEASDTQSAWRLLQEGSVVTGEVPASRFSLANFYDANPEAPFRTSVKHGGFLRDIENFDANFFHIAPLEVITMDPQQRLLLEVGWEALEQAGETSSALLQKQIGVFVGAGANEYAERLQDMTDQAAARYVGTGNLSSVLAGRLSYFLGASGPSLFVDTACSSSLVALHLACQSLHAKECQAALVGGVNLLLSPSSFVMMSQMRALSLDGRCKTFSADADGYGRAEGCVVVVLKRLSDAVRDGNTILGLVRGTAVNHDGASSGLTAPNGPAQQAVIRQALQQADINPAEVDYVECHGTGTKLGDPIEVQALAATYGFGRAADKPLILGAVKANLGHMEAASGLAGLIKVILALQHEQIPPQPPFFELNAHIPWAELPVRVARHGQPWPRSQRPRRAGISAFGLSGTNAHIILEEAPSEAASADTPGRAALEKSAELCVLSAQTEPALFAQAGRLHAHLLTHSQESLADIAYTLASTRSAMECRLALSATSRSDLLLQLESAARGTLPAGAFRGRAPSSGMPAKVVFVFPGQGWQWLGMGRSLLAEESVFAEALTACDRAIQIEAGFSVLAELAAEDASTQRVDVVQPVLFAMQVALAALWRSWGIKPDAVVGHSLGEIAAAYVAGALSLKDAVAIICRRSRLLREISGQGEMALVELPAAEAAAELFQYQDRLSVAASNSLRSTVISGEPAALGAVLAQLESRGVFCRRVQVDVASHSPQVEPLLNKLQTLLADLHPRPCVIPMYSTVRAEVVAGPELGAQYWTENLRQPVRFCDVMQTLHKSGHGLSLELSAHPILVAAVEELRQANSQEGAACASLRRGRGERVQLLSTLGELWGNGYPVAWNKLFSGFRHRVDLPPYPWQKQRFWVDPPNLFLPRSLRIPASGHPLLGTMQTLPTSINTYLWESTLESQQLPWLFDHQVQGAVVFPGAAYLEMALALGAEIFAAEPFEVSDVSFVEALPLAADAALQMQVLATEEQPGRLRFHIASRESQKLSTVFRIHARGVLKRQKPEVAEMGLDLISLRERLQRSPDAAQIYAQMATMGLTYGQAFQGIAELWGGAGEALGRIETRAAVEFADAYRFHPALLDACMQVIVEALGSARENAPWLPLQIGLLRLFQRPPSTLFCHARLSAAKVAAGERQRADLCIVDSQGGLVAEIQDLVIARRTGSALHTEQDRLFMAVDWQPSLVPPPSVSAGRWLLLGDGGALGQALRQALQSAGHSVVQGESLLPNSTALRALLTGAFDDKAPTAVVHLGRVGVDGASDAHIAEKALLQGCDNVLHVVQALVGMSYREAPRLWLFTRGAQAATPGLVALTQAPLWGLGRTIAVEHPELRCVRLDLDPARPDDEAQAVVAELLADDAEEEVAFRGKERLVARLIHRLPEAERTSRSELVAGRPFRLEIDKPGVLDHLRLRLCERRPPGPGEVEIAIEAAGLNFMDILTAMGIRPGAHGASLLLGGECAGRVVALGADVDGFAVGDAVLAVTPGCFGSHVTVSARKVVARPAALSAAEAAALPVAYMTAWYGLVHLGRLRAGERVLIHSATGGTGFAAVLIAQHLGAEVFATAGTAQKRDWLQAQGVRHVLNSRSLDFSAQILAETQGVGVDLVLNSLSGPAIEASFAALGQDGRFIELGKSDIYADRALGLGPFKKSLSYSAVDLAALGENRPERFGALLAEVTALIRKGVLPTLPLETFPISRAAQAFRKMAQAQHIGKLVLCTADKEAMISVSPSDSVSIRSDSSYLVTGGLGGLGLKVAEWLSKQGAGHLVLMGRAGDVSFEQRMAVSALVVNGTRVSIAKGDVAKRSQMEQILSDIQSSGMPLRGIIHAAGCLDDGLIMQQTPLRFRTVMGPKVQGAWHLHELTCKLPLDFFVMYASAAGLLGSPGQANYAAANTFLDALAHHRRALELPALSIDWGAFSEVGLAAEKDNRGARLSSRGMQNLTPDQGLAALGRLLGGAPAQMGVVPLDIQRWGAFYRAAATSRRLSLLQTAQGGAQRGEKGTRDLQIRLVAAEPSARASLLAEILLAQVGQVLRLAENQISMTVPLTTMGMDSLMGLELRNRIESVLGIRVPASLLWSYPTVGRLAEYIDREITKSEVTTKPAEENHFAVRPLLSAAANSAERFTATSQISSRREALVHLHTAPSPSLHLICFPPGGGGPELFQRWTTKLPDAISISGLHLPGRGARLTESPYADMQQLLEGIREDLVRVLKNGTPVAFVGHSLGSIVAFETARHLLRMHGVGPIHLFVSACAAPRRGVELEHYLGFGKDNAQGTFSSETLTDAELLDILRRAGALGRGAEKLDDDELRAFFVPSLRADLKVLRSYSYEAQRVLSIPITAIVGRQDPMIDANRITDWMKHTDQSFAARIIPGDHSIRYEQLWEIVVSTLESLLPTTELV